MEMSESKTKLPQVGQENSPKSHPVHSGCPMDSGGGNQTFLLGTNVVGNQATTSVNATGQPVGVDQMQVDPFARRSRLSRSPMRSATPKGDTANLGLDSSGPETPPSASQVAYVRSPYEAVISVARQEEEELLEKCLATLGVMKAASGRQKNMSQDVKTGIAELEIRLKHVLTLRKSWVSCEKALTTSATQTTPPRAVPLFSSVAKRTATSPAELVADKRKRFEATTEVSDMQDRTQVEKENRQRKTPKESGGAGNDFQPVLTKRQKRKAKAKAKKENQVRAPPTQTTRIEKPRGPRQRPDAILIKPANGKSYADVLGEIRRKANPEEKGTVIKALRKTKTGDLLVELGQKKDPGAQSRGDFSNDLQSVLGDCATVRLLEPKATLEVRDLDELATETEVSSAVAAALGVPPEMKTFLSKANSRGQKAAVLTLGAGNAAKLLSLGFLKIGWLRCRVREKLVAPRCYRCLGFGHFAGSCKAPDRSNLCFKCGSPDHKAGACSAEGSCVVCAEAGLKDDQIKHAAGSSRCQAYRKALEKIRSSRK